MNELIPSTGIPSPEQTASISAAVQVISEHIEFVLFRHNGWIQSSYPATQKQHDAATCIARNMLRASNN